MNHRLSKGLILLLLPLMLSSCWSHHELNDMSIVVGMGIDRVDNQYIISIQTVNPGQVSVKKGPSSSAAPVITYEETGMTIPEALTRMTVKAPRHLYFAHLRMVVISEKAAQDGIAKSLDYLSRNNEMRTDFYFIIAKQAKASDVLKVFSVMDPIPANNMFTKLETSDNYWAATGSMNLNRLLQELGMRGKSPTMTGVEISGNRKLGQTTANGHRIDPPALIKYAGMAAFKSDRFVGWLDENDTKALNYVQDSVIQTLGQFPCPDGDGRISMQVIRSKSTIKAALRNGQPEFDVYLRVEQDLAAAECKADLSKSSIVAELKKASDKKLEALLGNSIKKIQKQYGTDIYGFGEAIHRSFPETWHQIKDWDQAFAKAPVRIHANTVLRRVGTILQPIDTITKQ
ncbi:Ger(x)C family spore germination protein [Paenibacillus sp. H1-7]|uniref:Ger(x)C family spore germination protein n=1 Tax=Paenibacillus sp. H1-7 TaxID=2282849 RepID=UPI001EF93606|nr:Ger(x)C family spore germination protein [Paenibacillus sp. H1-7]ULL18785.1 Ger(x)C family spore germination protein [Paenibacillus sp. H1-7]